MSDAVALGSVRVIGGPTAHHTKIEVWCGDPLGWVKLRGVVAIAWATDARRRASEGGNSSRLEVTLEPMLADYYESVTGPERVALRVVGVTDDVWDEIRRIASARHEGRADDPPAALPD